MDSDLPMMATTHAYVGAAVAVASLPWTATRAPATAVLAAGFLGGLVPDLDLVTSHRKTLHFPLLGPVVAAVLASSAVVTSHPAVVVLTVAVGSAGLHALSDVLAGGVGYAPWENESSRAVYNHCLGRWHSPRRLVRYSGAPEDFVLAAAFAVPVVLATTTTPLADVLFVGLLVMTAAYAAARRRLSRLAEPIRSWLPAGVIDLFPSIRFEDG